MAARAQAQINAAANVVPSESIELPDINSEYSDSDDEDRVKYQAPHWAQSPALRRALEDQADINPDEVFGPIQPLNMEDVFRTRLSRFRARTSSANWAGADRLTEEEELEYARRMGFRQ
ncbi:inner centromere protein [Mucidula mucida]|nr:inner centromere protein [Mucidula mucida]